MSESAGARLDRHRRRLLRALEAWLEAPMFLLAVIWLALLVLELTRGLAPALQHLATGIWVVFIIDFGVKLALAPRKLAYVRANWLTAIALLIPAFRVLRAFRALTVLRASGVASTTYFLRVVTSANRFLRALARAQGPRPTPEMNVGLLLAHTATADKEKLLAFIEQLARDATAEMERATSIAWKLHPAETTVLDNDNPRQPADFVDDASLRMVEGPFDVLVVVTDAALMSRRHRVEAGLASPVSRIVVLSTRKLVASPRGQPVRDLGSETVRWNGAALLLHLLGHLSGLRHAPAGYDGVMAPYAFDERRNAPVHFNASERAHLRRNARRLPERELRDAGPLGSLIFHVVMAGRHPLAVIRPLIENRAPLLPLALPGLATAAVAPTFLLVFTAEIWDVGLSLPTSVAAVYATVSVLAATVYLLAVQSLFLPRREKRLITEHLAVANSTIFLSMLLAVIGLFLMVGALMLTIEVYLFPQGLIATWPTLDRPSVDLGDKIRLAAFISTIGVTTGALAGGLESRAVIQHLALFRDEP